MGNTKRYTDWRGINKTKINLSNIGQIKYAVLRRKNDGEVLKMSRPKVMSDALKYEIAKKLGVDKVVSEEGWGGVSARDCGNIVREAIMMAEKSRT